MSIHLKKTAYGIMNGKDLTKPMERSLEDGTVTLVQDAFVATGTLKGNVVNLSGKTEDNTHHMLKMVLMDNVFIYHSEVWKKDMIVDTQWAHVRRLKE